MRHPRYLKNNNPTKQNSIGDEGLSDKFDFGDITSFMSPIYYLSLFAGGVILYQYFNSIHYLPTIELTMILWVLLFTFGSGLLTTIMAFLVILLPGLMIVMIDYMAKLRGCQNEFREFIGKSFTVTPTILVTVPWIIWTIVYYYHYRTHFKYGFSQEQYKIISIVGFLVISIVIGYLIRFMLPDKIKKMWGNFVILTLLIGVLLQLDYQVASFLYDKPIASLPNDNKIDVFLMLCAIGSVQMFGLTLNHKYKSKWYMAIIFLIGTIYFLLSWESPDGKTLSKNIMKNFKLGYTEVTLLINKDYFKKIYNNNEAVRTNFRRNVITTRMLTMLGSEYVLELKTCNSCHGKQDGVILIIPKDKVESISFPNKK